MMKSQVMAAAAVLAFLLSATVYAQNTQQGAGIAPGQSHDGFTIAPARGNGQPAHGYEFDVAPGAQAEDFAYIKNFSANPVHFSLYGADPTVSNTGSPAYKTHDQSIQGPGTWVKFDQPEIDLAGGEEKTVRFIVSVPADAPPGDYRAGITMEKGKQQSNLPGISIATRMVSQAKIKVSSGTAAVTGTESGQETAPAVTPLWKTYYFWISLGFFIISLALLVWALLHEKKTKHGRHPGHPLHQGGHEHHAETHPQHARHGHGNKHPGKHGHGK